VLKSGTHFKRPVRTRYTQYRAKDVDHCRSAVGSSLPILQLGDAITTCDSGEYGVSARMELTMKHFDPAPYCRR
jgi:hypothetical protein